MDTKTIFLFIWAAMIAMAFWESSAEGRNAWNKTKVGWKIKIGRYTVLTRYHFWIWVMWIIILTFPLALTNWEISTLGKLISALLIGFIIEDFCWYLVNPQVRLKEFYSPFSDYYPWIKIGKQKIIPVFYLTNVILALLSWYFLWK